MSNHTPGPWVSDGHTIWGPHHPESRHKDGRVFICLVSQGIARAVPLYDGGAERIQEFDSQADVNLIVTAPEILEELKDMLQTIQDYAGPTIPDWVESKMKKAERIIAKAGGAS